MENKNKLELIAEDFKIDHPWGSFKVLFSEKIDLETATKVIAELYNKHTKKNKKFIVYNDSGIIDPTKISPGIPGARLRTMTVPGDFIVIKPNNDSAYYLYSQTDIYKIEGDNIRYEKMKLFYDMLNKGADYKIN